MNEAYVDISDQCMNKVYAQPSNPELFTSDVTQHFKKRNLRHDLHGSVSASFLFFPYVSFSISGFFFLIFFFLLFIFFILLFFSLFIPIFFVFIYSLIYFSHFLILSQFCFLFFFSFFLSFNFSASLFCLCLSVCFFPFFLLFNMFFFFFLSVFLFFSSFLFRCFFPLCYLSFSTSFFLKAVIGKEFRRQEVTMAGGQTGLLALLFVLHRGTRQLRPQLASRLQLLRQPS